MQKTMREPLIRYTRLAPGEWNRYGKQLCAIEKELFPPALREPAAELRDVFMNEKAIFLTALRGDEAVGFVCGEDLWRYVWPEDPEFDSKIEAAGTAYIETIDVRPSHQGKGIGSELLRHFLFEARKRGYKYVAGHWRAGASAALAQKFGGVVRMTEQDYLGTGEEYQYIIIKL